ncbi:MAG: 16S rRNA processing protein RimM [Clostridiales bacterium]|nr:16S rRNA processing protein RimM [Clostridiales bacterium]
MILDFIEIGKIVGTHGIRGELRVNPWCDSPEFFKNFSTLYFDKLGKESAKISSVRAHGNIVLLKLDEVTTVELASSLRGKILYIKRSDAPLEEGRYFVQELIGCQVKDASTGKLYGTISDVSATGANDVWHIKNQGQEYLIPAIPDVVVSINVENEVVEINPLRGLFDDEN